MMAKNLKLTTLILTLITIGLILLTLFNIYKIRKQNEETSLLLTQVEEMAGESASAQAIRSSRNKASEEIERFESIALTEDKLVSTLESIESIGKALSLTTDIVSVEKEEVTSGNHYKVSLLVETEGEWSSSLQFLKALESIPNRVLVDEVHFEKEEDVWTSRIGISLYIFN